MPFWGPPLYGPYLYGTGEFVTDFGDIEYEITRKRNTTPIVKVEYIDPSGVVTDISRYYESGGNITREKERAPDELQAGDFDITLFNHDDKFSEYKAVSIFYGVQYHMAQIKISIAFRSPTGMTVYYSIATGYIDELDAAEDESKVTLRCRDIMHRIIDGTLHLRPTEESPVAGGSNGGDGTCSAVSTKPFSTVSETWTITCTTPGVDGVGIFGVVGSVSGNIGNATSGTEFKDATYGLRFTLAAGTTPWALNDVFTFQTLQRPEWTAANPAKIIWSVLTGYNFDTGVVEAWASSVLDLDPTLSAANPDIDYAAFVTAAADLAEFSLTGYADYDESAQEFIQGLLLLFLGSVYTNGDGRISIKSWTPKQSVVPRTFEDAKKITSLGYTRSVNEIINYVRIAYKKTATWQFSGDDIIYDGWYLSKDAASIAKYGKLSEEYTSRWYMSGGTHVQLCSTRLISRYSEPPLVINFATGADGLLSDVGDRAYVTDQKYGFLNTGVELSRISKVIDSLPLKVEISARRDEGLGINYGYLGSRVDEGDGKSPQADTWGAATASDKTFCYLGRSYVMY